MIVVIQCAASKRQDAGYLHNRTGEKIFFVAQPDKVAKRGRKVRYVRPDDISDTGKSYRQVLADYNRPAAAKKNPFGLLPAWQLYKNPAYRLLAEYCGLDRLYILSAGWGLIAADFLTPLYDITFSKAGNVDVSKRRGKNEDWPDFAMLPVDCNEPVMFLGGRDYLPLFCKLTGKIGAPRLVWHNCDRGREPDAPGCQLRRFASPTKTNWHYQCARNYVEGKISVKDAS